MNETTTKLTAAQRASLFAQATRQNRHMLPKQTTKTEASSLTFSLPKARLLSSILVNVEAKVKLTGSTSGTYKGSVADMHSLIRRWSLDLNNGFSPYVISGRSLYYLNLLNGNTSLSDITGENLKDDCVSLAITTTGASSTVKFAVELSVALNERDAVGYVLLQNNETNVELRADIGAVKDAIKVTSGTSVELEELSITPMITTFSIPASADAFPDLSVLKLVNSRNDSFVGSGQHEIKLPTGTIYRRFFVRFTDEDGNPFSDSSFNGNIELLFNTADINYSISPEAIRTLNRQQLGFELPTGVYAFDLTYQGVPNYGGTRDYIDSERLTSFSMRFNTTKSGRAELVTETLARLQ